MRLIINWPGNVQRQKPSRWGIGDTKLDHAIFELKAESKENDYPYGHLSSNGYSMFEELLWNGSSEPEGIGQGPEDTFQEEMAEKLATAGGGMVDGRGGTGSSHLNKLLKPTLEHIGYKASCIDVTHVAVANLCGVECVLHTTLHYLHRFVW